MNKEKEVNKRFSIPEFARLVGVSPQAIHQQIDKKLKEYIILDENGKKYVRQEALKDVYNVSEEVEEDEKNDRQEAETLRKIIEILSKQIDEKDKQIEKLQKSLDQAQQLHMAEHQEKIKLLGVADQDESNGSPAQAEEQNGEPREENQKKGLFKRWFSI